MVPADIEVDSLAERNATEALHPRFIRIPSGFMEFVAFGSPMYCTFLLGDLFLGVDILQVQEVITYQEMTVVPRAPTEVSGLINLRGDIVIAIDLRCRFGMPERSGGSPPMNVVLTREHKGASLLVDRIADVVEVDECSFEPPPSTVGERTRDLLRGASMLDDRLLLLLDTAKAVNISPVSAVPGSPEATEHTEWGAKACSA